MNPRLWKALFFVAFVGATWLFLVPAPPEPGIVIPFFDKLAHAGVFLVLGLLAAQAYTTLPRGGIFASLVFYAICIEIAQPGTGRSRDLWDVVAGATGALVVFLTARKPA